MKLNVMLAMLLIAAGIGVVAYQGLTYTSREKVVDIGALQVTAERTRTVPLSPVLGGAAIAGGLLLLAFGDRKG